MIDIDIAAARRLASGGRGIGSDMKAYVLHPDDGSTLYEWIDKNHRFGISIEAKPSESGWYFVTKDGTCECGELPEELLHHLATAAELDRLAAALDAAREALTMVEWIENPHPTHALSFGRSCPWCDYNERLGHAPDCARQRALGGE